MVSCRSESLMDKLRKVEPATIGHFIDHGAMHPRIKPIFGGAKVVGRAVTVRIAANDSTALHCVMAKVGPGDVIVVDRLGDTTYACTGEVVALAAKCRGAEGIVVDGPVTDIGAIREMNFPVFSSGTTVMTTKLLGLGGEVNVPIQCGGVPVFPGDIIVGDDCGVLVLKPEEAEALADRALAAEEQEQILKAQLRAGALLPELSGAARLLGPGVRDYIKQVRTKK